MELISSNRPTSASHLVVMPFPGRGHINPMMNLCTIITSRAPDLLVTFVVTEEWAEILGLEPETKPRNLRLVSMPNVVPSEHIRGSNPAEFLEAVSTKMEAPFETILDRLLDPPPTLILSDSFLVWATPVANRRNIPVASVFPMSAAVLSRLKSVLEKSGNSLADTSGSYLPMSGEQMDEFRAGLVEAEVPFLWVVRGENHELQKACGDRGLIVPWCDQLKVLCHPAVGGFLSHCGWNSVQEGIYAATPFITFPLGAEQFSNSKMIVEDWKIGLGLKKAVTELPPETEPVAVVKRAEISGLVKRLMDLDNEEGKQIRINIRQLQGLFHQAVSADGSTTTQIDVFSSNFMSKQR